MIKLGSRSLFVAVSAAAVIGAAPAAQAAPGAAGAGTAAAVAGCPFTNTLCLFDGAGYTGVRFTVSSMRPGGTCVSLVDHGWGGRARSALNTNAGSAALFANDDCVGGPFQVAGNSGVADFGTFRPNSAWVP